MGLDLNLNLDMSALPKELNLLLHFMKRESGKTVFSRHEELFSEINWDVFLKLTHHHRIYPYIYSRLKEIDPKWIPAKVVQEVCHGYQKNTFHMLRLSGEMDQLCKLFIHNKIDVLLLKGPSLAADLYGDVSRRTSSDLDMLIPLTDLDQVHELLVDLNYVKEDYFSKVLNEWKWRHHHVTYFNYQKGIKLEIHWRLHPGPSWEPTFNELWERKRVNSLTTTPVYMLGKEDLFLFLIAHGGRHGWSRLRWLVDMDRIVNLNLNWAKLTSLLKKYHLLQVGGQSLILASQLLSTPLTQEMKTMAAGSRPKRLAQEALFYIKQMVNLHDEPLPEEVATFHKRHLFSLMSIQQKMLYLLSLLYPFPMDVETLPLPKKLHFLYFPLRPFLCVWRKIRNLALS